MFSFIFLPGFLHLPFLFFSFYSFFIFFFLRISIALSYFPLLSFWTPIEMSFFCWCVLELLEVKFSWVSGGVLRRVGERSHHDGCGFGGRRWRWWPKEEEEEKLGGKGLLRYHIEQSWVEYFHSFYSFINSHICRIIYKGSCNKKRNWFVTKQKLTINRQFYF